MKKRQLRNLSFLLGFCLLFFFPCSVWALPVGVHHRHVNSANKIALTFDDGPHPHYTLEILDVLEEYGIHGTFFFVGENVLNYPDAARRVAQGGHEIGNHTYHHVCPDKNNCGAVLREELAQCERAIQQVTDTSPKLFRPPQGNWNEELYTLAREQDYDIVLWNIDTLDWAHTPAEQIAEHVLQRAQSGDIILMHDYHSNGCTTTDALRQMIPALLERGFHFVTVSELLGTK
ncbi:MAG: polysaccharide deacetylase family protein [Clostridia bacterium]|nr:polysaccharide deacetylase family protein [Clostridia bacterium]